MSVTLVESDTTILTAETQDIEKIANSDPRSSAVWINPARVSGVACFAHSRVPLQILWDHLEEGASMDEFLEGYEGVSHEQAKAVLRMALEKLLESLPESTPWR